MSTYGNTPKTQTIRKKLKELRKELIDAIDAAGNNTMMEEFESVLPKIKDVIISLKSADIAQQRVVDRELRQRREQNTRGSNPPFDFNY